MSIPRWCSACNDIGRRIRKSNIPSKYRSATLSGFQLSEKLGTDERLAQFLAESKGVVWFFGPTESGKTTMACALLIRFIEATIRKEYKVQIARDRRFQYVQAPIALRGLYHASFKGDDDEHEALYEDRVVVLDDLDKVEERYRPLVRDLIVFREQTGKFTFVTTTHAQSLLEFDPQVQARIKRGKDVALNRRSNSDHLLMRPLLEGPARSFVIDAGTIRGAQSL